MKVKFKVFKIHTLSDLISYSWKTFKRFKGRMTFKKDMMEIGFVLKEKQSFLDRLSFITITFKGFPSQN